jgi:hypothetical protein
VRHVKLFKKGSLPFHMYERKSKSPDGLKPGDRYSQAESRAYARMRERGRDKKSPEDWETTAEELRHDDPRACSIAFLIGGRQARTRKQYELGNRLAQESGRVKCSWKWVPGVDSDYPIEES